MFLAQSKLESVMIKMSHHMAFYILCDTRYDRNENASEGSLYI